jgi:hypothetical protein
MPGDVKTPEPANRTCFAASSGVESSQASRRRSSQPSQRKVKAPISAQHEVPCSPFEAPAPWLHVAVARFCAVPFQQVSQRGFAATLPEACFVKSWARPPVAQEMGE